MTREDIKTITDIIHKTIYGSFDVCGDDEETPMTNKDKLLLEINKAICNNLKALEQEPKTGHWIPVSERLPENQNQEVLISLEWGIDIGGYRDGEWHSEWINHYDDGNVLAWMPLPKPYEPQESEDKE